jgi:hypothetical protein
MTLAGATPRRKYAFLDGKVLHRPIGRASLTGLEEVGRCPRKPVGLTTLFWALSSETGFSDCSRWIYVRVTATEGAPREEKVPRTRDISQ